ncbi:MAG TPA: TIM-barrel domain-containing protein [Parafilimonas sp.]|nr:TIM-barrel domain-containing protein [Parafilimonas sp.]
MQSKLVKVITGIIAIAIIPFLVKAQGKKFEITNDGIIVYPDKALAGNVQIIKLEVISDKIIRVMASGEPGFSGSKSLITIYTNTAEKNWTANETNDAIVLKTQALIATVNKQTGAVSFTDVNDKPVLKEKQMNGRSLKPVVYDGEGFYKIKQTFETTPDDALYGLGQHQDGIMNYRNQQVYFFQNNTEVTVPFLISSKNYGILWDNYSLSTVGDIRPFEPLSSLKLFSANGEQGWLTASYFNDKSDTASASFTKAESFINYPYLGDTKLFLPADFKIDKGLVRWSGSFSTGFTGVHKFRFTYAGYFKVWINGNLLVDRWRQPWNPGSEVVNIPLAKDIKYAIKIEWIPDGGESYATAKWLSPVPGESINDYSFLSDAGNRLDYYFIYGNNMDSIIAGYRYLTGKATIAPNWAMGFWQSRERYKTQDEILSTVKEFRQRKIPLDNIVQDWSYWKQDDWGSQEFDPARFPDADSMIKVVHQNHAHFMISVWPKFYEGITAYKNFDSKGWLYKRNIADRQRDWIAQGYISTFYDAFNAGARKGFWDLMNEKLFTKGVDAWWMDASEPDILSNVSPEKRLLQMTPTALGPAAAYLNAYPLENAKGIYEGQRSADPDKRVFLLTRSGFAGSQRYAAAIWSGDISATWGDMKTQISAGINFSMSGIPYWTMDIGGFATEQRYQNPQGENLNEWRELNTRWFQFGAFCPLFRSHGQYPFREIYNIAPEGSPAYNSMVYYDKLRYKLMPYIYSLAGKTYVNDYTLMRGLAMDFGSDENVKNIGDQYMFGPSLLINPVYTYKATSRDVYLPAGQGWYDLYSGKYFDGGKIITAEAPYDRMPVFVKAGSIIPTGPDVQYTNEKPADVITLFVYTGKDANFSLYEDEGTNYNYEQGKYSIIPILYNEQSKTLTIGKREGGFDGMLKNRKFKIVTVSETKPVSIDATQSNKTISYKGDAVSTILN